MENKYYTPEIEEFHVGFEYEMIIPVGFTYIDFSNPDKKPEITWSTEYRKGVFQVKPADPFEGELASITDAIKVNKCRIKSLDREDIESLGFMKDSGDCDYIDGDHGQLEILHEDDRGMMINISTGYGACQEFYGRIKNKSELKNRLSKIDCINGK